MRVVVWGNGLFPGVLHGFFYSACLLPQAAPDDFYEFCVFFKFFRRWFVGFLFLGGKAGGSFQEGGDRLCRSFLHAALDARMVRKEAGDEGKDGWQ